LPDYAVAVLVNGISLYNPKSTKSWDDRGVWHYNNGTIEDYNELATFSHSTVAGLFHYHSITPEVIGLTEWDDTVHSPIVGWAFDGLPIYGPYGYRSYKSDNTPVDSTDITNIKSPWVLRQGNRELAPGGAYTGVFIEDFEIKASSLAEDIKWTAMDEIPELAFDHNFILSETYALLKQKLLNEPVCFDLLPERFTLNEMQQLYEFALETEMDKANFRKKIKYVPLIAHDEKQQNVKHRPAKLFSFNKKEYSNQVAKKDYQFKM
jgi:hypothetical protein